MELGQAGAARTPAREAEGGPDGIVSMEAEHYHNKVDGSGTWAGVAWTLVTAPAGYSGDGAMQALPDGTTPAAPPGADAPRLDFNIDFVKTGTHYVWIRGYAPNDNGDSCHLGLDGTKFHDGRFGNTFFTTS